MGQYHSVKKSFFYAFTGLKTAVKNEPNLRIHLCFAAAAITIACLLNISRMEWLMLLFIIFWVISLELINTVLEELVDLVSPEMRPHAKVAKDVSAAVVLLGAILSVIVGFILFLPKLLMLQSY